MTRSNHFTTVNLDSFFRNAIGGHRMFENMLPRVENNNVGNYPPYNIIEDDENHFRIELAVAGFDKSNISITVENSQLRIDGNIVNDEYVEPNYIHKGISSRAFNRSFELLDHIEVESASMENGILTVFLVRNIPESLKPKRIDVK